VSILRIMKCDGGCGRQLAWAGRPTQAEMEQQARDKGWHAPDKTGNHFCLDCRRAEGAAQWWRKENVRLGLPAGYGLGQCPGHPDPADLGGNCVSAGHPGVVRRVVRWRRDA